MEITVYNPQKERLETLYVEFTAENTTRFIYDIHAPEPPVLSITDLNGGLLIKKTDFSYPIWLCDMSRADIDFSEEKAEELMQKYKKS
jgi:hypothetical protein